MTSKSESPIQIHRTYAAPVERVWELWTTGAGIQQWWAPDGFTVRVDKLDLRPDGELIYTMTATAAEQVEFMRTNGLPLETRSHKTFTEVTPTSRLCYTTLVDFVPDVAAYEVLTEVDLHPTDNGTEVTMTIEPMHDTEWTQRLVMGRKNEMDNLTKLVDQTH
ncbi:SRPBCC domain-containing protein [Amycolatopsis sp. GM8]|uniref:SRPBCC family protein n=1 Tax=Amycolatopsis sp. GM8 TaxID=2896530 RepID=UPI001F15C02E|nr:SRPBCC domain-containing protein [Amycolatopsis sp. GM8]